MSWVYTVEGAGTRTRGCRLKKTTRLEYDRLASSCRPGRACRRAGFVDVSDALNRVNVMCTHRSPTKLKPKLVEAEKTKLQGLQQSVRWFETGRSHPILEKDQKKDSRL